MKVSEVIKLIENKTGKKVLLTDKLIIEDISVTTRYWKYLYRGHEKVGIAKWTEDDNLIKKFVKAFEEYKFNNKTVEGLNVLTYKKHDWDWHEARYKYKNKIYNIRIDVSKDPHDYIIYIE